MTHDNWYKPFSDRQPAPRGAPAPSAEDIRREQRPRPRGWLPSGQPAWQIRSGRRSAAPRRLSGAAPGIPAGPNRVACRLQTMCG